MYQDTMYDVKEDYNLRELCRVLKITEGECDRLIDEAADFENELVLLDIRYATMVPNTNKRIFSTRLSWGEYISADKWW